MDPFAHTLAGATMAQTGLKKLTPLATATLVIGANLPDVDAVFQFVGRDTSLYYRRGMTHGVLALMGLPLLLTGAMLLFDRFVRRRRAPLAAPARGRALLLLACLGVLSHPALDWLNTYGVRLLMPFSGRWFYGDTLFIVDAWMWLLMAASAVFAHSRNWLSGSAWLLLGGATTVLITTHSLVPAPSKVAWCSGVAVIIGLRMRGMMQEKSSGAAVACIVAFCLYLAAMGAGNGHARQLVAAQIPSGSAVYELMTNPLPADPLGRQVIAVTQNHYHGYRVRLFGSPAVEPLFDPVPRNPPGPVESAALRRPEIRGFANWMRFPVYSTEKTDGGYRVTVRDLRYVLPTATPGEGAGIGIAQVFVRAQDVKGTVEP